MKRTPRRKPRSAKPPNALPRNAAPEMPEAPKQWHPIAGIGASAGGLDALTQLLKHLPDEPGLPIVIVGICFGGALALLAAADGLVDGVVTWHGTRMEDQLGRAAEMRCPMRLHFGNRDPFVPMSAVAAVQAAFAGRHDVQVVVHDGATHGYSHRDAPQAYDQRAEQAGVAAVRELLGVLRR